MPPRSMMAPRKTLQGSLLRRPSLPNANPSTPQKQSGAMGPPPLPNGESSGRATRSSARATQKTDSNATAGPSTLKGAGNSQSSGVKVKGDKRKRSGLIKKDQIVKAAKKKLLKAKSERSKLQQENDANEEGARGDEGEMSGKGKGKGRQSGISKFWLNNSSSPAHPSLSSSTNTSDPSTSTPNLASSSSTSSTNPVNGNNPSRKKDYMSSGIYCQNPTAKSPFKLINKVLSHRESELKALRKKSKSRKSKGNANGDNGGEDSLIGLDLSGERPSFPPLPYDFGEQHFFGQEHEFELPFDIQWAAENGGLDGKKRPAPYQKLRSNVFPERQRLVPGIFAICHCDPQTGCDENCMNRIMSYICGKDCPAGEACQNKMLSKRKQPNLKIVYTGARGFGLFAGEDIQEGDFVIDYRGEIIALDTFYERCRNEYSASKNYYALAYDQDEVIDAGARANEARFINHGCQPNLEVRKFSTLGEGIEEFEVGMWATRDIKAGEELFYDYNFDWFTATDATECKCGAPNCVGYLGRKPGEKSAREKEIEQQLSKSSKSAAAKKAKKVAAAALKKGSAKREATVPPTPRRSTRAAEEAEKREERLKKRELKDLQHQRELEDIASQGFRTPAGKGKGRAQDVDFETPFGSALFNLEPQSAPAGPSNKRKSKTPSTPVGGKRARGTPKTAPHDSSGFDDFDGGEGSPLSDLSEEARLKKEEARKRRISGWAEWLRKKASERVRTREEWEEFALQRRRGKAWKEKMMVEYGVAAYPGGPAEPYSSPAVGSDLPASGQPKRRGPAPGTPRPPRASKSKRDSSENGTTPSTIAGPSTTNQPEFIPYPVPDDNSVDPALMQQTLEQAQKQYEELFNPNNQNGNGTGNNVDYFENQQRYTIPSNRATASGIGVQNQPRSTPRVQQSNARSGSPSHANGNISTQHAPPNEFTLPPDFNLAQFNPDQTINAIYNFAQSSHGAVQPGTNHGIQNGNGNVGLVNGVQQQQHHNPHQQQSQQDDNEDVKQRAIDIISSIHAMTQAGVNVDGSMNHEQL